MLLGNSLKTCVGDSSQISTTLAIQPTLAALSIQIPDGYKCNMYVMYFSRHLIA